MNRTLSHSRLHSRAFDYLLLTKPELTMLSVLTALCGFYLGTLGAFDYWRFFHVALGTTLVGGGAGALNQFVERRYDALMKRTERRPLPAGRLRPIEGLIFGSVMSILGIVDLCLFTNNLTGILAAVTFSTYIFLYTPLKRITPYSTLIGAIPGALPPVLGWAAARNDVNLGAAVLFAIVFCWQMPHFLSLAWMYRRDYARAGFKILTVGDPDGKRTSREIVAYSIALVPVSLLPASAGMTGLASMAGAVGLSLAFLFMSVMLVRHAGNPQTIMGEKFNSYSRQLFFASLVYLPSLLLLIALDKA
ncbi:MAG TPA: heme o synthase [Bacteroidota bacterium]|nr:heme o synthase [Bacteroidota bacterium]